MNKLGIKFTLHRKCLFIIHYFCVKNSENVSQNSYSFCIVLNSILNFKNKNSFLPCFNMNCFNSFLRFPCIVPQGMRMKNARIYLSKEIILSYSVLYSQDSLGNLQETF
jgi:hypothetical protein